MPCNKLCNTNDHHTWNQFIQKNNTSQRKTERARTELLRKINLDQSIIEKKYGIIFVVKKLSIHYISTASLDDSLVVKTKILELNKAKVIFSLLIYKNKILISKLEVTVCCLNKNRKITRMNNKIYDILNSERELYE